MKSPDFFLKFILISVFFFIQHLYAQDMSLDWAHGFGGTSYDVSQDMTIDDSGYVYVTGYFNTNVDFDPGVNSVLYTAYGNDDIFIQKLDSFGNLVWAKHIGNGYNDRANSIATDDSGYVYVTGYFNDTIDFDPGVGVYNVISTGGPDMFILKLNSSGDFIWVKSTEGAYSSGENICLDHTGNIYVSGEFGGIIDLDPGLGVSSFTSYGQSDAFILKLDTLGNFVWAKRRGSIHVDKDNDMILDRFHNIYLTGYFADTVDFDPGVGVTNKISNGDADIVIQKLNSSGDLIWVKTMGGSYIDMGMSISLDTNGYVYSAGLFSNLVDFDPNSGTQMISSQGEYDAFVLKLDTLGNFIWVKTIGGVSNDVARSITVKPNGDIICSGVYSSTCDLDPNSGVISRSTSGIYDFDIYIQKLDANGNLIWVKTMGSTFNDLPNAIISTANNQIYTTGYFSANMDFDPNADTFSISNQGNSDYFIQKLKPCVSTSSIDHQTACNSYTWINGVTYTANNNTATTILANNAGCDSVVTLNLTLYQPSSDTQTITACGNYTWIDGNSYSSNNNTATHTLTNSQGCDSVIYLDLTILNNAASTDIQMQCDSLVWIDGITYYTSNNTATYTFANVASNGCDSIVSLNLTILSDSTTYTVTACDSFNWIDGNTYYLSNNSASHTLTNSHGCDSTIILDLTLNHSTNSMDYITACDSFTWLDGITYTLSNNTAVHTITNSLGCDSIITLDLTIHNSDQTTETITSCDSYTWIDGITYYSNNNTATHTLTNSNGCDSIITLNLIINQSDSITDIISACGSYTWINGTNYTSNNVIDSMLFVNSNGCDSIVYLDLTINYPSSSIDTIVACDNYTWIDGITYTSNNTTATHTLINSLGCDSVVTLNLTIHHSNNSTDIITACQNYTWINGVTYTTSTSNVKHTLANAQGCDSILVLDLTIIPVDTSVIRNGLTLDAQATNASFQWVNCNTNAYIPNQTNSSYQIENSGQYAVEVTQNNCTDTSSCFTFINVGIEQNRSIGDISVYPNPTKDAIFISIKGSFSTSKIRLLDQVGHQLMYKQSDIRQLNYSLDLTHLATGTYYIEIIIDESIYRYPVFKL
ncbi:SBBP repeat-containing protein [bacterium SCSIO 12643]|nr:SBBP repeat-containing protein [bacterium SCSIO 12643]